MLQSEADDSSSFWTFGIPALFMAALIGLLFYKVRKSRNEAQVHVPAPAQPGELFERRQSLAVILVYAPAPRGYVVHRFELRVEERAGYLARQV